MDRFLIITGMFLFLSGCSTLDKSHLEKEKDNAVIYNNTQYAYAISVPSDVVSSIPSSTGSAVGFINFNHWKDAPADGYYISVESLPSCPPLLSSKEEMINSAEVKAVWGNVDTANDGSYAEPNCLVKSIYPEKQVEHYAAGYAFCAEKNDKAVFICIKQMTDNPALAKKIFESFKWTK